MPAFLLGPLVPYNCIFTSHIIDPSSSGSDALCWIFSAWTARTVSEVCASHFNSAAAPRENDTLGVNVNENVIAPTSSRPVRNNVFFTRNLSTNMPTAGAMTIPHSDTTVIMTP